MAARDSALARLPLAARVLIILIVLVLAFVAYWIVFHVDITTQLTTLQRKEVTLREELAKAKKAQVEYQKDLAEFHEREQRQTEIEKILPSEPQYPAFLSSIQAVADLSGIILSAWSPRPEVTEQYYARVPMHLKFRGRYHQVAKFFHNVGQLERVINMENISITSPKLEGDELLVQAEALATAFRAAKGQAATEEKGKARRKKGAK